MLGVWWMDQRVKINRWSRTAFFMAALLAVMAVAGCTSSGEETIRDEPTSSTPETILTIKNLEGTTDLGPECSDKTYLEETADFIIDGTVVSIDTRRGGGEDYKLTQLDILAWGKGNQFPVDGIQIVTSGVSDQPSFQEGQMVRLYIQKSGWDFTLLCGHMGVKEL